MPTIAIQCTLGRVHDLKTDPEVFSAVLCGEKTYEIRYNDRNYQPGEILVLKETKHTGQAMRQGSPLEYTGRQCAGVITHVLAGPIYGLVEGWAILSFYRASIEQYSDFTDDEKRRFRKIESWVMESADNGR